MIVCLSTDDTLTIKAENELESYALKKWSDGHYQNKASLLIKTDLQGFFTYPKNTIFTGGKLNGLVENK